MPPQILRKEIQKSEDIRLHVEPFKHIPFPHNEKEYHAMLELGHREDEIRPRVDLFGSRLVIASLRTRERLCYLPPIEKLLPHEQALVKIHDALTIGEAFGYNQWHRVYRFRVLVSQVPTEPFWGSPTTQHTQPVQS